MEHAFSYMNWSYSLQKDDRISVIWQPCEVDWGTVLILIFQFRHPRHGKVGELSQGCAANEQGHHGSTQDFWHQCNPPPCPQTKWACISGDWLWWNPRPTDVCQILLEFVSHIKLAKVRMYEGISRAVILHSLSLKDYWKKNIKKKSIYWISASKVSEIYCTKWIEPAGTLCSLPLDRP